MKKLLKNCYLVTVDREKNIYPQGALIIERDKIAWVGAQKDLNLEDHVFEEIIDLQGNLVIPGLINAHTHNVYYLMRGLGMDRDLKDWLKDAIWPCLKEIEEKEAYLGSLLGCLENIKSGTTSIIDNYYMAANKKGNIDGVLQGITDTGIKAIMARGYHDLPFNVPAEFLEHEDEVAEEYLRILDKWHEHNGGKIKIWISPVNLLYSSLSSIKKVGQIAKDYEVGIHTHVAEANFEVEEIKKRYGKTFIEVFADLGLVNEKFHSVHSVCLEQKEIDILADSGSSVMFNPSSNMLLASGIAPIEAMYKSKLRVTLGTDAPNNNQDMLEALKYATLLPRVKNHNPLAVTSYQALEMATIEGARAMGQEAQIGSLEKGKQADITVVNLHKLHNTPSHDPVATLVYASNQSDVDTVFINGEMVLQGGKLVNFNEQEVIKEVVAGVNALYRRCGIN